MTKAIFFPRLIARLEQRQRDRKRTAAAKTNKVIATTGKCHQTQSLSTKINGKSHIRQLSPPAEYWSPWQSLHVLRSSEGTEPGGHP
mmetsp:Transcript_83276/g.169799  ORF Transcript_83276/g.169799 Transcript_83276/m.169799 type:complete len:87 (+) Transcript_83276:227-487(+)